MRLARWLMEGLADATFVGEASVWLILGGMGGVLIGWFGEGGGLVTVFMRWELGIGIGWRVGSLDGGLGRGNRQIYEAIIWSLFWQHIVVLCVTNQLILLMIAQEIGVKEVSKACFHVMIRYASYVQYFSSRGAI